MSSNKLTYFNLTALGESIRFLLHYGGVNFEDNRVARDDWPKLKPTTPLGQLPVLEFEGKTFYQSNAIIRFLAKKFNLFGSSDYEAFEVDATLETITDLRQLLAKWGFNATPEEKAATQEETFEKSNFYLGKLEAAAKKNGGYLVGSKLTVADIVFAGLSDFLSFLISKDITTGYPSLKAVINNVVSQPKIKSYIAKRPKTEF